MIRHAWLYAVAAAAAAAGLAGAWEGVDHHLSGTVGTYISLVRGPVQLVQGIRGSSAVEHLMYAGEVWELYTKPLDEGFGEVVGTLTT
jgi:hypothetical protein